VRRSPSPRVVSARNTRRTSFLTLAEPSSQSLLHIPFILSQQSFIAMAVCLLALAILYRKIHSIERGVKFLGIVVVLALLWIIFAGFTHFNAHQAFDFPLGASVSTPLSSLALAQACSSPPSSMVSGSIAAQPGNPRLKTGSATQQKYRNRTLAAQPFLQIPSTIHETLAK
jgi:hypothetical protein